MWLENKVHFGGIKDINYRMGPKKEVASVIGEVGSVARAYIAMARGSPCIVPLVDASSL